MTSDFLHARYANVFRIGCNEHEMIFDFGQVDPDGEAEAVHTRIIIAVANGKLLLKLLADAVAHHDAAVASRASRGADETPG